MGFWEILSVKSRISCRFCWRGRWLRSRSRREHSASPSLGGLVLAIMLMATFRPVSVAARSYVELMRGTPALTQLFIIYFGLADIGLGMPPLAAAIVGLGANGAAYLV